MLAGRLHAAASTASQPSDLAWMAPEQGRHRMRKSDASTREIIVGGRGSDIPTALGCWSRTQRVAHLEAELLLVQDAVQLLHPSRNPSLGRRNPQA